MATQSLPQRAGEREAMAAERILRGVDHYSGAEIRWVAPNVCYVSSRSNPDSEYRVTFTDEGESCFCPDFKRHGRALGLCLHTVAAMIDAAKQSTYHVEKRHDSRIGREVYVLIESKAGVETEIGRGPIDVVYAEKWALENPDWNEAA